MYQIIGASALLIGMLSSCAQQFVYPVALMEQDQLVYVLHQKSLYDLELLCWHPATKNAYKLLPSFCIPAGLHVLPSQTAFSFIDQERVRVKKLVKRSAQTIDFDEPLYNIMITQWLDDTTFYGHAAYNDHFGIFQGSIEGTVIKILYQIGYDFQYPQKINDEFFAISRLRDRSYTSYGIIKAAYCTVPLIGSVSQPFKLLLDFGSKPIAFLSMLDEKEGFFLEYPSTIDAMNNELSFTYHHVIYDSIALQWTSKPLFSFIVPYALINHHMDSLYESIIPLLPRYYHHKLYYVSILESRLVVYSYNIKTGQNNLFYNPAEKNHCFPPFFINDHQCILGSSGQNLVSFDKNGEIFIDFPLLTI